MLRVMSWSALSMAVASGIGYLFGASRPVADGRQANRALKSIVRYRDLRKPL
jgi:hypothetical protein